MFDKLVVSEPEGADFKSRRRYFVTSSVVVGVLFLAAVVASIFAADFSLGNSSFELVQMVSPPELATLEPETPQRQQPQTQSTSSLPTRTANIPRIDESPTIVPQTTSTTRNTEAVRPVGHFISNARFNTDPVGGGPSGREISSGGPTGGGLRQPERVAENEELEQAPPREIKKPRLIVSKGPINSEAKYLPKPVYSVAARAVRAQGPVLVQVTIDERGNVISANAVKGHALLLREAEKAARNAKFSPTTLADVPIKVTGVITYNFVL